MLEMRMYWLFFVEAYKKVMNDYFGDDGTELIDIIAVVGFVIFMVWVVMFN